MSAKVIQIWRKVRAQWPYLPQTLRLVWEAAQHRTLIWAVLLLLQGLLPLLLVYLTRSLVNSLVTAINATASPETVHPTLTLVILLAALLLLTEVLRSVTRYVRTSQTERVQDHVNHLIHQKSIAVDLAFYESPDYYDRLHRARAEAKYRPAALLENIGSLFQNAITLVAMVAILAPFGIWLPAALVASTLPALFVVLYYSTREHEWRRRTTVDERRSWYYDWLLTVKESAAEVRLFGLAPYFQAAYQRLRRRLRRERLELLKQESLAELAAAAFALLVMGTALAWMVWKTVQGGTTLGDLALFYQAFYLGQRLMRSLLENVGNVYSNSLFLSNLFEFLELEPRVISPSQPLTSPLVLKQGLCFQGVTFRYPRSGRAVLHDFNLNLPAGEVAAVVGPNGAGKSTLIKLICRFYDPQEGHIELDGVDLRKLALEELRERIAVLFQEPMHYNTTAARNIALGDLMNPPDESQIRETARAAGAHQTVNGGDEACKSEAPLVLIIFLLVMLYQ